MLVVVCGALAAVLALSWSWDRVKLDANTDSLMGTDRPYVAEYNRFLKEFGDLEYVWVVIDTKGETGQAQYAADLLEAELKNEPSIETVNAKVTAPEQMALAAWAMPERDLAGLVEAREALPLLASNAGAGVVLSDALRRLDKLKVGGAWMPREEAERTGAAAALELEAIAASAPGAEPFLGTPRAHEYLASPSGHLLFVGVMPRKDFSTFEVINKPLDVIRTAISKVQAAVPQVEIGLTGKPVLQADELATTNQDMNVSSLVALVLCTLLFMAVFRGFKLPVLALLAFLVGCALTYAAAALFFGRLNLLSIVFMLVLVGVGLDYGIHMVARYLEGRRQMPVESAIVYMMRTAVPSNVSGALTSAGVFLMAWFTEFQGLRELGVVSGVGLLLTLGSIVLILPALLVLFDARLARARTNPHQPHARKSFLHREAPVRKLTRRAALAVVSISGVTALAAAAYGLSNLRFESNLLKLQAEGLQSVAWEHRVIDDSAAASWFGAIVVDSMDKIPEIKAKLAQQAAVGQARSVLDVMPLDTPERAALRTQLASAVESAPAPPRKAPDWDESEVREAARDLEFLALFADRVAPKEATHMRVLSERLRTLAVLMDPRYRSEDEIAEVRQAVETNLARAATGLHTMADGARRTVRDALPAAVRAQMISPNGKYLVMVNPRGDVWDPAALEGFVGALRAVDKHATGVPMTVSESMRSMERSFVVQAILATLLVAVLLAIDLRSFAQTMAALLSLVMGVAWTIGVMALVGASFNLANFFAVPMLIGLGIDSAIHMTHRAHEGALDHGFGSTRRAVIVTALTTTIGFGALLLAHHQGLRSLGIAMGVGSLCCLISAVWTLPALLRVIGMTPRHAGLRLVPEAADAITSDLAPVPAETRRSDSEVA